MKKPADSQWGNTEDPPGTISLFPGPIYICLLKNTLLYLQFKEAFGITLISSKQQWLAVADSLVIFRFLEIAQQTSGMNVKDYQIKPFFGLFYYTSHWCQKCLCDSLWGNNSSVSIWFLHSTCWVINFFLHKITLQQKTIASWVKHSIGRNCNLGTFKGRSNYAVCFIKHKQILAWLMLIYFCKYITLERDLLS